MRDCFGIDENSEIDWKRREKEEFYIQREAGR